MFTPNDFPIQVHVKYNDEELRIELTHTYKTKMWPTYIDYKKLDNKHYMKWFFMQYLPKYLAKIKEVDDETPAT